MIGTTFSLSFVFFFCLAGITRKTGIIFEDHESQYSKLDDSHDAGIIKQYMSDVSNMYRNVPVRRIKWELKETRECKMERAPEYRCFDHYVTLKAHKYMDEKNGDWEEACAEDCLRNVTIFVYHLNVLKF